MFFCSMEPLKQGSFLLYVCQLEKLVFQPATCITGHVSQISLLGCIGVPLCMNHCQKVCLSDSHINKCENSKATIKQAETVIFLMANKAASAICAAEILLSFQFLNRTLSLETLGRRTWEFPMLNGLSVTPA